MIIYVQCHYRELGPERDSFISCQFTWANNLPSPTYELLDCVLMSVVWEQNFPLVMVHALYRSISDHTPPFEFR
jgi:hypothetical protein